MASPVISDVTTKNQAAGSSIVCNTPANTKVGDLLIGFFIGQSPTNTAWFSVTQIGSFMYMLAHLVTGATEPATYTFTGSIFTVGVLARISGAAGLTYPLETTAVNSNGASTNYTAPTVTTTVSATELLVNFYGTASTAGAITVPGSQSALGSINGNGSSGVIGWENLAALGATGTRVATGTSATNGCFTVAFFAARDNILTMGGVAATVAPIISALSAPGVATMGGVIARPPFMREQPFWLADVGSGPSSSAAGSSNVTASTVTPSSTVMNAANAAGTLSGTVSIGGVATANCLVCLYWRPTGQMIKSTRTSSAGTYSFSGLDLNAVTNNSYFAVAVDPDNLAQQFDSIILDRLIPG